jgi:hypothetical protein
LQQLFSICFVNVEERNDRRMILSFAGTNPEQIIFEADPKDLKGVRFRGNGVAAHLDDELVQVMALKAAPWLQGRKSLVDCFGLDELPAPAAPEEQAAKWPARKRKKGAA